MKENFFIPHNVINHLSERDIQTQSSYLDAIRAFAQATYASIYVIDYEKQGFEYVSDNPLFLCCCSSKEVLDLGYGFYKKYVEESDYELLITINRAGFEFFNQCPIHERKLYTISYDFSLLSENSKILVNQKLTPIVLTESGQLWKALCVVSMSSEKKSGNIRIYKKDSNLIFRYDLLKKKWLESEILDLSIRQKEILQLSIRGFTITEIAENLHISVDTIKFHRRKLFNKLQVSNMSEAIFYATNHKLL